LLKRASPRTKRVKTFAPNTCEGRIEKPIFETLPVCCARAASGHGAASQDELAAALDDLPASFDKRFAST
jgi:hypothetical protein